MTTETNAGCDRCGTADRCVGSNYCAPCELQALREYNQGLREALQFQVDQLENWRACLKLPPDLEEGFNFSIEKARAALAERGQK